MAGKTVKRVTLRLSEDDYNRLSYWADKKDFSINEFIPIILDRYIDIENGDYQLPTLEAARMNQMLDVVTAMSQNMESLTSIVVSGFDSLLQLSRGDNYLLEHEDGEI